MTKTQGVLRAVLAAIRVFSFLSIVARAEQQQQNSTSRVMLDGGRYVPMWHGRLDTKYGLSYFTPSLVQNSCSTKRGQQCSLIPGRSYPYQEFVTDPFSGNPDQPILKVSYPAGSWSPSSEKPGGVLIYSFPTKTDPFEKTYPASTEGATLEYEVFFPDNFEWVKGGKLPGMMGGASNGIGCGGGNREFDCFSFRIMWRREGYGEAYVYAPFPSMDPDFCSDLPACSSREPSVACHHCTGETGYSIGRATFQFQRGSWNTMKLQMKLNTVGMSNGVLKLVVNGQPVVDKSNMVWRTDPSVNIEGVNIASWFGGSSDTWSPSTDQETRMRNFRMYYDGPYEQMARTAPATDGPQVVVNMQIDEAP
jgi:hypothetical protein